MAVSYVAADCRPTAVVEAEAPSVRRLAGRVLAGAAVARGEAGLRPGGWPTTRFRSPQMTAASGPRPPESSLRRDTDKNGLLKTVCG